MSWHNYTCVDVNLRWHDGVPACDTCGSSAFSVIEDPIETPPPPPPPKAPKRSQLKLSWPPCVAYFGPIIDRNGNNVTAFFIDNIDGWEDTCPGPVEMKTHGELATESAREGRCSKRRRIESSLRGDIPSKTDQLVETPWIGRPEHALETLYGHLPEPNGLRLLLLHGAESFNAPVHCSMMVTALEDPEIPTYEALSYTWADIDGDKRNCMPIFIGPQYQVLMVTRNCQSALRSLRARHDRVVWVDAICINQHNPLERQFQVGMMPEIYASAARVMIYLGEERDASETAMKIVAAHSTSNEDSRDALSQLLGRPYFHRIWVIQEIAHAQKASVICGNTTVHWSSLCSAFKSCDLDLNWIDNFSFPKRNIQNPPTLLELLIKTRNSDCADPRDRVFALIGLVHPDEAKLFPVDYSLSVQQVYTGLAAYWAQQPKGSSSFDFISFAQSKKKISGLPSWVPDWSNLADRQGGAVGLRVSIDITQISITQPAWGFDATEISSSPRLDPIYTAYSKQELDQPCSFEIVNYDKAHIRKQIRTASSPGFTYNVNSPITRSDVGSLVTDGCPLFRYSQGTLRFAGVHRSGLHIDHSKLDGLPRLLDNEQELDIFYFPRWCKALVLKRHNNPIFSVVGEFTVDIFASDYGRRTKRSFMSLEKAEDHIGQQEASLILSWRAAIAFLQESLLLRSKHASPQIQSPDLLKYTAKRRTLAGAIESPITYAHLEQMEQMRTEMLQSLFSTGVDMSLRQDIPKRMGYNRCVWLTVQSEFEKRFSKALTEWTRLEGQPEDLVMSWKQELRRLNAVMTRGSYVEAFRNICGRGYRGWIILDQSPSGPSSWDEGIDIDGANIFHEPFVHLQKASLDGSRSWEWNRDRFWICLLSFDLIARLGESLYNRRVLSLLRGSIRDGKLEPLILI